MYRISCKSPVLILNPQLFGAFLKGSFYLLDGKRYDIFPEQRSLVLSGSSIPALIHLPKVVFPEYKDNYSEKDYSFVVERFYNFLENSVIVDSDGVSTPFWLVVPCGKCEKCLKRKLFSYTQRCEFAFEESGVPAYFVTLTYRDSVVTPNRRHVQLFFKRLRKLIYSLYPENPDIKYLYVSEVGSKFKRIHYHLLLFGLPYDNNLTDIQNLYQVNYLILYCWRISERVGSSYLSFDCYKTKYPKIFNRPIDYDKFSRGYVNISRLDSSKVVSYVLKYSLKSSGEDSNFRQISSNMGLKWLKSRYDSLVNSNDGLFEYYSFTKGFQSVGLSSYYINKIFPSYSKLVPVLWRRSYYNIIYFCGELINSKSVDKNVRMAAMLTRYYYLSRYPQFIIDDFDNLSSFQIKYSTEYNAFKLAHSENVLFYLNTIAESDKYIRENPIDFSEVTKQVSLRDRFLSNFLLRDNPDLDFSDIQFVKSIADYKAKSIF